jgi:uncharacterized cupin superfamily protein
MNKLTAFGLGCTLTAGVTISVFAQQKAAASNTTPVRFDRDKIAGIGLTAVPPDAYKDILVGGQLNMRVATLFDGKELRASVFESTPAKTDHRTRPNDTDEFVFVQSGKLILTEPGGTVHEFRPGDTLMLPVGYTGTWEMQGNYREIAVTMKKGR